eukprot:scaffold18019_cov17-Tisochrysis_lutea.AAC.1
MLLLHEFFPLSHGRTCHVWWPPKLTVADDLDMSVTLVGVFVVSGGNLAASYVVNVVNQTVFTILQELCAQRAKE